MLSPPYKKTSLAYDIEVLFNKTVSSSSIPSNSSNNLNLPSAIGLNTRNPEDKLLKDSKISDLILPPIKDYKSKLLKGKR